MFIWKRLWRSVLTSIPLLFLCNTVVIAQGPPIHTDTAIISGLEGAAIRIFVKSIEKSGSQPDGSAVDMSVSMIPVMIPYEVIPNRLLAVGMVPYVHKEKSQNGQTVSTSGWSDLRLLAKYNFFQKDALKQTTRLTWTGGIKLPTGKDDEVGIPPPLQLGSGSVDYLIGTTLSHIYDRMGLHGDLFYTLNTEANNFKFGDTLQYDLAIGFRLLPAVYKVYPAKQVNAYLELNGLYAAKDKTNGQTEPNSGGNTIFLSPGIQFVPGRAVLLEASVQIPIMEDLNETALKTDSIYTVGFRWLMF